jgi:hypothetical protein
MMDSWYQASPLSALEVEARRVAAEEGRFPPNAPGMTHYSSGVVEYNDLPRTHSRSRSDSSCGTPPAYPDNRLNCTRAGQGHLPATSNHGNTSCSDQFLPVTNYVEECISYHQPPWKSDHKIGTSHPDLSAAFTTPNQHSNLYDLLWRRRPSHALQSRSVANPGFQAGYSPSSSPSSAQKQAQFYPTETRPYHYPGRYTFINQVFKPLYKTDREKETGNNHALTSGDQKSSQLNILGSLGKLDLSKSTKSRYEPYDRLSTTAVKKPKRANEKRFPCKPFFYHLDKCNVASLNNFHCWRIRS